MSNVLADIAVIHAYLVVFVAFLKLY